MATTKTQPKHTDDAKQLGDLAELACDEAKKRGASQAMGSVSADRAYKVVIRDGKQEEIKSTASRSLTIRLYVDGRYASHTTSDLQQDNLRAFIGRAVEMTRMLMPDKHRALPDPKHYAGRSSADLKKLDPAHAKVTMADRKQRAIAAHDAARAAAGDKVLSVGSGASDSVGLLVLRTTNGFADSRRGSRFWNWADVSVKDPSGRRPSDWAQDGSRRLSELLPPEQVGKRAAERTLATVGAKKIDTLTLPLVIENRAVGRVLGGLISPLNGWALDQKRSCFEKSLGQQIASDKLDVVDDPLVVGGLGSRRFDGEGLTARKRPLFEKGVLRSFFIDSYYGRKLGREPTSGGSSNLTFAQGSEDLDALCQRVGKAILITSFLGGNSNSTTGDFSHGIAGFLIEGGKRTQPIASMNIADNHKAFWKKLEAVGNDPYRYSSRQTPSLLFSPIVVAGK